MRHSNLRDALSRELSDAPSARIDRVIGAELAEDLEGISSLVRKVSPYVAKAAPGALQGAAKGFLVGGPAGALVGAVGGGLASSGALSHLQPAAAAVGAQGAVVNPAALELLLTLLRPEVTDMLIALAVGKRGASAVPVAGTPVPPVAVTNLIQSLAEQAAATHHALRPQSSGTPRYLSEAMRRGENVNDTAVRAGALLSLVHEAWDEDLEDLYDDDYDEDYDD